MLCRHTIPCVVILVMAVAASSPLLQAAEPTSEGAVRMARQLWAVADLVLEKHIAPPSRQEMLLTAVRSLTVNKMVSAELGRRISDLTTPEKLAPLLQEFWPQTTAGKPADEKELALTLMQALFQAVPGTPRVISLDQSRVFEQLSNNRYVGTGIQISWNAREGLTEITNPFPGGPARKAGARPGDLIMEVDGVSMAKVPLGKVVELLRGAAGSPVSVVVRQAGSTEQRTLKITRGVVPIEMLVGYQRVGEENWNYRVNPKLPIAYVRVSRITSSALHELRQIERRVQAEGCRALILDLRFTHEGDLQQGARVADAFLESGLICRVGDRQGNVKEYPADADCLFRNWPVAVLIGNTTRGPGAEVVATALQDQRRAVLVGEPTPGEAFVTSTVPLPDNLGVVGLPTAVLERSAPPRAAQREPSRSQSVQPDHLVPLPAEEKRLVMAWQAEQEKPGSNGDKPAPADAALAKALDLLRAALK